MILSILQKEKKKEKKKKEKKSAWDPYQGFTDKMWKTYIKAFYSISFH